uniref:Core Histone H2A/H2B/H3 domain-containing protein n=1 Tax=Auxenochlorella protothecoides TaxID=3075 RepID=A0A1D1ZS41_AUXPR
MTTPEVTDAEIPKALLKRLIKAKLSTVAGADPTRDYQIHKDALLAFQEAAKIFIHYLTATANDVCRDARRQTISAEDVLTALNDLDFGEVTGELTEALEDFRTEAREKSKKKAEGKKRKAEETADAGEGEQAGASMPAGTRDTDGAEQADTVHAQPPSQNPEGLQVAQAGVAQAGFGEAGPNPEAPAPPVTAGDSLPTSIAPPAVNPSA